MYSRKFSEFVRSGSLPISCCLLFYMSITCAIYILNNISWYCVLHIFRYFINCIISEFQFTSRLCLTSQSYFENMSMLFKSITTISICSLYPLISTSSGINHVTSLFLVPSALKNSNTISTGFILIFSSLTSHSLILICMYPEFTSTCNCSFFLFCVLILFTHLALFLCYFINLE